MKQEGPFFRMSNWIVLPGSKRKRGVSVSSARCFLLFCLCKLLETGFLVPALFGSRLHLLSEGCALVWGMFVRGCARRDLC